MLPGRSPSTIHLAHSVQGRAAEDCMSNANLFVAMKGCVTPCRPHAALRLLRSRIHALVTKHTLKKPYHIFCRGLMQPDVILAAQMDAVPVDDSPKRLREHA